MKVVSSYLMGGLGNQLFQIFVAIAYGIEYKRKILLKNTAIKIKVKKLVNMRSFISSP